MKILSVIPKAERISGDELDIVEPNDYVIGFKKRNLILIAIYLLMGFAVLSILLPILIDFVAFFLPAKAQDSIDAFFEQHNYLWEKGGLLVFFGSVIFLLISVYFSDLKIVISDRQLIEFSSKNPKTGQSNAVFFYIGIGMFILMCTLKAAIDENGRGDAALFWFILLVFALSCIKNLVIPILQKISLNKRARTCTVPVTAEYKRSISLWSDAVAKEQQFSSLPVYAYCYNGQNYSMRVSSNNNIAPDSFETIRIMIDPANPDRYYSDEVFIKDFGKVKAFLMILLTLALMTIPIWGIFLFKLIVDKTI